MPPHVADRPRPRAPLPGPLLAALLAILPGAPGDAGAAGAEPPAAAAEALAAGDAHYARRAEGARGGTAQPLHIDGAIAEYRRALALDPRFFEARLALMRAFFFRTGFCGPMDVGDAIRTFDEAKKLAEETVALLDADTGRRRARVQVEAARALAPAAEAYVWAAVSWGQWAVFHHLAAAWQGAPKRIRDLAETVLLIDPATAQAGAYVILGRLHCEAPRIPMLTGWISREKGIAYLRQGLARAPDNPALVYFLADALLTWEPARRAEARALLERGAASTPRPDFLVEDAHYAEEARERLAGLR
jgi:tetratricopeptide (TPR) repeat protein